MEVNENEAEEFAEVEACDHLFKGLLARAGGVFVDYNVVGRARENVVFVVEGAVFAVYGDGHIWGEVVGGNFGDGAAVFHVSCVATCAEDATNFHGVVGVCGSNEGSCGVVDQGAEPDGEFSLLDCCFKEWSDVLAFDSGDVKTFRPALEHTIVYVRLSGWKREGKAQGDLVHDL